MDTEELEGLDPLYIFAIDVQRGGVDTVLPKVQDDFLGFCDFSLNTTHQIAGPHLCRIPHGVTGGSALNGELWLWRSRWICLPNRHTGACPRWEGDRL